MCVCVCAVVWMCFLIKRHGNGHKEQGTRKVTLDRDELGWGWLRWIGVAVSVPVPADDKDATNAKSATSV